MKKISIYILGLVMFSALWGCEKDFLEVNIDPNNAPVEKGTPELVFPAAIASSAARIGGEYAVLGGMWAQFWAQSNAANQYKFIDQYNVNSSRFNGSFTEMFSGALNDYTFVINNAEETENWIFFLMGTVMKAYNYQVMADLYDQVPYDEAFLGDNNLAPAYEDGKTVYGKLIASIDDALTKDFDAITNSVPGKTDLLFSGDLTLWKKFANTLKLKMYLRMVNADASAAQAGVEAVFANGIGFLGQDAAMTQFEDAPDKSNPFYEYNFRQLNVGTNLRASNTLMSYLKSTSDDARLAALFTPGSEGQSALYQGQYGASSTEIDPGVPSVTKQSALEPVRFISAAESYFMQAEAIVRYGVAGDAKAMYDAGVNAAFNQFGFDPDNYGDLTFDATPFLAPGGKYEFPTAGSMENKIEAIIVQKWVSCAGSHSLEAFFEQNRTGYPQVSTVPGDDDAYVAGQFTYSLEGVTGGLFPKRLVFPDTEINRNPNTPATVAVTQKVWWSK